MTSASRSSTTAVERALRVGAVELDVLARADPPAEIADGAAEEARPEVEAEHERGLGHRLEVGRAVAGAARRLGALADEPGLEERAQRERDRRLGNPRVP